MSLVVIQGFLSKPINQTKTGRFEVRPALFDPMLILIKG
jgi:hypothetical protein